MEIIIYDDCSMDDTPALFLTNKMDSRIKYHRGEKNLGVGDGFNEAIKHATGDIIVLMCADDLFTNKYVLSGIARVFDECPAVGHVSRWYYQFVDGFPGPVRAWRTTDPIIQANNPSGLAFRKSALKDLGCSNKMFIETSYLVSQVLKAGWRHGFLYYDAIAARVHRSTSTQKGYWLKRRVSSPIEDWHSIGGSAMLKDYCSLIQIKCNFTTKALIEEIGMFIKLRPVVALIPMFWFYCIVSLLTPRGVLRHTTEFYRHRILRYFTSEAKRD